VGAVTGASILKAQPVAAADGDYLRVGMQNDATLFTGLTASAQSALVLQGGTSGVGVIADGDAGNAWFPGTGLSPAGTAGLPGLLWIDGDGNWWGATADSATDGVWRKLAGPGTAGQLHVLPTPVRVYDSRPGLTPAAVGPKIPTVGNSPRAIDTTGNGSGVPLNATAVLVNLTITAPQAAGYATAWPAGAWPGTSSINFAPGQSIAATTVVGCGVGASIQIQSNTVTDFLIDVIGYYQ
jgi:hypothetical protein